MKRFFKYTGIGLGTILLLFIVYLFTQVKADIPVEELKAKYTDEQSQFMELDGMQVHYKVEGQGHPLLLLHGTASSLHTWDAWTQILKDSFRIVRVDLPAFGLTGPNTQDDYSMDYYNQFLDQFVRQLGIDSLYVAGNSMGGGVAWNFALHAPETVSKLVLIDPLGYWDDDRKTILGLRIARTPVIKHITEYVTPRSLVKKSVLECYSDVSKVDEALVDRYYNLLLREGNRAAYVARMNEPYKMNSPRIKEIMQPTLILWGREDIVIPVRDAPKFEADIPNARLIIYDGVGHLPMEEIPERSAMDAMDFLQQE